MKSTDETQQDHSQHVAEKLSETVEITQEEHRNALLTEYEMCELHTWKWDNATWQTAAIFLSAAIASRIYSCYSVPRYLSLEVPHSEYHRGKCDPCIISMACNDSALGCL